jgi:tetratricopeptide (TPR) repeat protein
MTHSTGYLAAFGTGTALLAAALVIEPALAVEEIPYSDVDRYGQSKSKKKSRKAKSCPKGTQYSKRRGACVRQRSSCATGQVWSRDAGACLDSKSLALSDEDLYAAAYERSQSGQYAEALTFLFRIENRQQPKVLNSIGYSTRKLGAIHTGMEYYHQALALDPNYTKTRQYLGEAYLQKDNVDKAKEQLAEIGDRCGGPCEDYTLLVNAIAAHVTGEEIVGW